jgi:hypothetical protein
LRNQLKLPSLQELLQLLVQLVPQAFQIHFTIRLWAKYATVYVIKIGAGTVRTFADRLVSYAARNILHIVLIDFI